MSDYRPIVDQLADLSVRLQGQGDRKGGVVASLGAGQIKILESHIATQKASLEDAERDLDQWGRTTRQDFICMHVAAKDRTWPGDPAMVDHEELKRWTRVVVALANQLADKLEELGMAPWQEAPDA